MGNKLKILGELIDESKREIAEKLVYLLDQHYPELEGELYLGYPIYIDELNNRTCIDIALVSKIGVFIFNILKESVTDYGEIQDDIYSKIESKFKKNKYLFKKKRLIFDFHTITYSMMQIEEKEDYQIVFSVEGAIDYFLKNAEKTEFSDELYSNIVSALQEAYGINSRIE